MMSDSITQKVNEVAKWKDMFDAESKKNNSLKNEIEDLQSDNQVLKDELKKKDELLLKKELEIQRLAHELQRMKIASENEIKKLKKANNTSFNHPVGLNSSGII